MTRGLDELRRTHTGEAQATARPIGPVLVEALMSLAATCKARGIDAAAYLRDVLARIAEDDDGDPATLSPRA